MKVLVATISDRASRGEYEDLSGPMIERVLHELIDGVEISRVIVADEHREIEQVFADGLDNDIIITTGGTGLSPRDITPEVTRKFCEREVPGIGEYLRAESLRQTPTAVLSRATAGMKGRTLIINFPGSVRGAEFCARCIVPLLTHAVSMIAGGGHSPEKSLKTPLRSA